MSHSPHGECGLKLELSGIHRSKRTMSLPAWGVWIEMLFSLYLSSSVNSHSPHGECGLKLIYTADTLEKSEVTPHTGSVD